MESLISWLLGLAAGLAVAFFAGPPLVDMFRDWLRSSIRVKAGIQSDGEDIGSLEQDETLFIDSKLVGRLERCFFVLAISVGMSSVIVAMVAWLGIKMLYNWSSIVGHADQDTRLRKSYAFASLLSGLASMSVALLGGLIAVVIKQIGLPVDFTGGSGEIIAY